MGGMPGAIAATVGIFLPSFLFVAAVKPLIPILRKSQMMSAFLNTVSVASVAIVLWTCVGMGRDCFTDWGSVLIGVASFVVVVLFKKVNSAFVVLGGAVASALLHTALGI
jgi:chromate transporter